MNSQPKSTPSWLGPAVTVALAVGGGLLGVALSYGRSDGQAEYAAKSMTETIAEMKATIKTLEPLLQKVDALEDADKDKLEIRDRLTRAEALLTSVGLQLQAQQRALESAGLGSGRIK
jgi:hypothetical protein